MFIENIIILVIDDEVEITKSLSRQFRKRYEIVTADSADEGLALLREHDINVIISDQRMPDKTGSEFFNEIKDEFPLAIRVLMTGYADINSVIDAVNKGNIFRYIVKPWDPLEFERTIQESIEKSLEKRLSLAKNDKVSQQLEQQVIIRTAQLSQDNLELQALSEKFESLSQTDELTQLHNRRYYSKQIENIHHRFLRYSSAQSLLIMDIDFFKAVNDTHGHVAGDAVLKEVAADILDCCRNIDAVCRIGGEEFAVILTETDLDEAIAIAERIRLKIAAHDFAFEDEQIRLTMSIGVCELDTGMCSTEWMKKADDYLFRAKQKGRDQICWQ